MSSTQLCPFSLSTATRKDRTWSLSMWQKSRSRALHMSAVLGFWCPADLFCRLERFSELVLCKQCKADCMLSVESGSISVYPLACWLLYGALFSNLSVCLIQPGNVQGSSSSVLMMLDYWTTERLWVQIPALPQSYCSDPKVSFYNFTPMCFIPQQFSTNSHLLITNCIGMLNT